VHGECITNALVGGNRTSRNHGPFTPLFEAAGLDVPKALPKAGKAKKQFMAL